MPDDEEDGSVMLGCSVEQQSCCSQHTTARIFRFEPRSDLALVLRSRVAIAKPSLMAGSTFAQQKK